MTFLWTEGKKGMRTSPCVYVWGGECLCDEGLSEKSRLVEFVFCSLYISSQLRDKTDKSAPPFSSLRRTYPFSCPPFLSSSLVSSLYALLPSSSFYRTLLGLTFLLGNDLPAMWTFKQHQAAASKSQTRRTFNFPPHFLSRAKMHSLECLNKTNKKTSIFFFQDTRWCTFCIVNFMKPKLH